MANELNVGITLSFSKGGARVTRAFTDSITVSGNVGQQAVQTVGTSEEALTAHSDIGTIGYVFLHNMDSTNYVEFGRTTGVYTIKLQAGEPALFRLTSGTTLYAKANTSACDVEYILIEA
jgi:hypothetical protein